jgi:hypothetical protein
LKNIDYLTFGAHQLGQLKALHLEGDFDSVINLLQGQVTSDCAKLKHGEGQPSALCDEKGYVLWAEPKLQGGMRYMTGMVLNSASKWIACPQVRK